MTESPFPHRTVLRSTGLVMWLVVGLASPVMPELLADPRRLAETRVLLWLGAFLSFGLVYWSSWGIRNAQRTHRSALAHLAVQTAAALLMVRLVPQWAGALLVVVAAQLSIQLPLSSAFGWIAIQTFLLGWILKTALPVGEFIATAGAYLGFQVFAVFISQVARSESLARQELDRVNAELRATRELLAEASRLAERTRISRELHDVLGHHLTALSLNLEVASHLSDGQAREQVERAQSVAKLLLADLRGVVQSLRTEEALDLAGALRILVEGIPRPQIHLSLPDSFGIDDPMRAQTLLRCVQEIVTNAVKHSEARNLWLEFESSDGGVAIRARDDGAGADRVAPGHGLAGMRERLSEVGGWLEIDSRPGRGFQINAWIPFLEAAV